MCHPDRSEAEWRDLLFQLFAPDRNLKEFMSGTLGSGHQVRVYYCEGDLQ
jgi:hypothetical protein